MCLIGPLGMKRGRGMRQEYSTTGARMQEVSRLRGWFSNRFLGEWTYILGLAAGRCRGVGWGAGGLTPPHPTQGSFETGNRKEVFGFPLKRWKGRFSLQTPFSVNFLTTAFSTLLSNWGAVLVFAKDRRPFLKAYDFRFVFSFTAITPEPHSTGGNAEVNR